MADFLTRLAERALGLVPSVQPILAPMYAPGQQYVGAEDSQEMHLFERGPASAYPQPEVRGRELSLQDRPAHEPPFGDLAGQTVHAQELSLQDRPAHEPPFGDLAEQTVHAREISSPLVPQGNQPSTIPTRTPLIPGRTLDEQPAADHPFSLGRDETASSTGQASITESTRNASVTGLHSIHPTDGASIPIEPHIPSIAVEQERDSGLQPMYARGVLEAEEIFSASALLPPLVPQGNRPLGTSHLLPGVDALPTQMPAELKAIRPRQGTHQVGYPRYPYNRVNQREVVPVVPAPQESFAPAPTIQVTIGRIEVRAAPAPTPRPQAAHSTPPVMSLDDYLNQRAKGGR